MGKRCLYFAFIHSLPRGHAAELSYDLIIIKVSNSGDGLDRTLQLVPIDVGSGDGMAENDGIVKRQSESAESQRCVLFEQVLHQRRIDFCALYDICEAVNNGVLAMPWSDDRLYYSRTFFHDEDPVTKILKVTAVKLLQLVSDARDGSIYQ